MVAGAALCCCAGIAFAQSEEPATANDKAQTNEAASAAKDETNSSPRERGRILVKRNPIASEYQVFGELGTSPGGDADGEGVDYRSFFPAANPIVSQEESLTLGTSLNYNEQSGAAEPGFDLSFKQLLGAESRWAASGQFRYAVSDRLIEHYESVWRERDLGGELGELYLLDRARYSFDEIYTKNTTYALQFGFAPNDRHSLYFKTYYQDYFDNFYRNRLELQIGSGAIVEESVGPIEDDSIRSASVTNARTRRYFGSTDNERTRQHHTFGGSYRGDEWEVDYSFYAQRWDLDSLWYNWNFNDFGLDFSYDTVDPNFPTYTVDNGVDILDTSATRFSSLRLHDSFTRDRDKAGRIDAERSVDLGGKTVWLQTGALRRDKKRSTGESRIVYAPSATDPLFLGQIDRDSGPVVIVDGTYLHPTGLDATLGSERLENNPENFVENAFRSRVESAQQSYDARETVSGGYLLGVANYGDWTLEIGARLEYTETATRGTVVLPESVNDPSEGVFIEEIVDPGSGATSIIKDLYSNNDYTNFLPSFEAELQLDEQSSFKAAWYQLLMRPQYFNIVDFRRISLPTQSISEGNPDLEPTLIDKFRLAWTTDSPRYGKLAAEAYLIQIESFFYGAVSNQTILDDGVSKLFRTSRVENGDSGEIRGFELQWSKPLESLPLFENGSFTMAYTFSDSEATVATRPGETLAVPERSDHLLKTTLKGQRGKLGMELQFSYQSEALDDVGDSAGQDEIRGKVLTTGINVRYAATESATLYLNAANLIDHPERSYEGSPIRVTRNQYSSWFAVLGARYAF